MNSSLDFSDNSFNGNVETVRYNPTNAINVGFSDYIEACKRKNAAHLVNGIPDYAYSVDFMMRQKLRAIPGLYKFMRATVASQTPRIKQQFMMGALRVGPSQFPEIYDDVVDCASRLGIGIPMVFVVNDQRTNALAFCVDIDSPAIILFSGIVERYSRAELKTIIAHECGHIHNEHAVYSAFLELISTATVSLLYRFQAFLTAPVLFALRRWARAGEVSCDRAAIICSDSPDTAIKAIAKLSFGAAFGKDEVNINELIRQYEMSNKNAARIDELKDEHPIIAKRVLAMNEFKRADVLYKWRPEFMTQETAAISKEEVDKVCEGIIGILKSDNGR